MPIGLTPLTQDEVKNSIEFIKPRCFLYNLQGYGKRKHCQSLIIKLNKQNNKLKNNKKKVFLTTKH